MSSKEKPFPEKITAGFEITLDDFHENEKQGRLAPWIVRRIDILRIAQAFETTDCTNVAEVGCGYGLVSWLLAMQGLPVTAIGKPSLIDSSPFRHSLLTFEEESENFSPGKSDYDGLIISRSGRFLDETPDKIENLPGILVKILNSSKNREGYHLNSLFVPYKPLFYWDNVTFEDINPSLYRFVAGGSSGSTAPLNFKTSHNRIIIFSRRDINPDPIISAVEEIEEKNFMRYCWEEKLDLFYRSGERLAGNNKVLWKLNKIRDESDFLRDTALAEVKRKGLML